MKENSPFLYSFLLLLLVFPGCSGDTIPPKFTSEVGMINNPSGNTPLSARVYFESSEPVNTTLTLTGGEKRWSHTYDTSFVTSDGLPVAGVPAGRTYQVEIIIDDLHGNTTEGPGGLSLTIPPAPENIEAFPPLNISTSKTAQMEPGLTLFSGRRRKVPQVQFQSFNQDFGMLTAVTHNGDPAWIFRTDSRISDFNILPNGRILYLRQDNSFEIIDALGYSHGKYFASESPDTHDEGIPVEALTLHHDVELLPGGNYVALSTEIRALEDYFTSEYSENAPREQQQVMGDRVIEFSPEGEIVWEWRAFDHLDPYRIGYETFSGYWERRGFPGVIDWTHANAVVYIETDDAYLINFRYLSSIVKINRGTGDIVWIFGEHSGYSDELQPKLLSQANDFRWPWHQHAPMLTPDGNILLFDNGNYQSRPFEPPVEIENTYSRIAEYRIDEENMTVEQVWTTGEPDPSIVSFAMGDVDWLQETGNILAGFGFVLPTDRLTELDWDNPGRLGTWTMIREYTHTPDPQIVWELEIGLNRESQIGWTLFGAERIPHIISQ